MLKRSWRGRRALGSVAWLTATVVVTGIVGELLVRVGIRYDLAGLRNPILFAHPFCDDDYHRLRFLWSPTKGLRPGHYRQDADLGWVADRAPEADVLARALPDPSFTLLLFGDSFMQGVPPASIGERIPALLRERMPRARVQDHAVAGYGLDQILLRFEQALESAGSLKTVAVVGILLDDLDRTIERFREGPKPYFVVEQGALTPQGTPVRHTPEEWLARHPVAIKSYLLALLWNRYRSAVEWRRWQRTVYESECRRPEKELLARLILERMVRRARAAKVDLLFVVLYAERGLMVKSWREDFLKEQLERLGSHYVDTKPVLLSRASADATPLTDFYFPSPNGHLNARGNALVADAIGRFLSERFGGRPDAAAVWRRRVAFGRSAENQDLLGAVGWVADTEGFGWTDRPRATARISVPAGRDRLLLTLETLCAVRRRDDPRFFVVRVEGQVLLRRALREFPDCWFPDALTVLIEPDVVRGGEMTVALELPYLLTPVQTGLAAGDHRRLGIAVTSVTVRNLPAARTAPDGTHTR